MDKGSKDLRISNSPLELEPANGHESVSVEAESRRVTWLRLLWQERQLLGRTALWGFAFAVLVAFVLPTRYESSTRLMPPDQQSGGLAMLAAFAGRASGGGSSSSGGLGSLGGNLGTMAEDLLGLKNSGALFIDMLNGPTIQDAVIQKFDLRKLYGEKYWQDARKKLAKRTDVKEDRKSGVITITVTDHEPQRAREMAQTYVDALNSLVAQVSTSSARRERMFVEQRLKVVKQNLDDALQNFSEFASKNATFDVPSQAKSMLDSEATLEGQLVAAESELEAYRQIYTDNNIRVRTVQARVNELRHEVETMSGNKAGPDGEQPAIPGDFPSIRKLPLVGVRWANLYRETKIQETVYELLTQEYELAKIQEAKEIPTVNVLDPPTLPEKRSFPPRILVIALGTLFSIMLAAVFVIGSAVWNENTSAEKQLATEIWTQLAESHSTPRALAHRFWSKVGGKNGSNGSKAA